MNWLAHHRLDPQRHLAIVEAASRVIRAQSNDHFAAQLCRAVGLSATDPRDKVYSILGISGFSGKGILPDYTASTTTVFSQAVAAVLQDQKLAIYYFAPLQLRREDYPLKSLNGLPSWVPDLRIPGAVYAKSESLSKYDHDYAYHQPISILHEGDYPDHGIESRLNHMCIPLRFSLASVSADLTKLCVPGIHFGTVEETSGDLFYHSKEAGHPQILLEDVRRLHSTVVRPRHISALSFVYAVSHPRGNVGSLLSNEKLREEAANMLIDPKMLSQDERPSPTVQKLIDGIWFKIVLNPGQRTMFILDDGHIGLSYHPNPTDGIRMGDIVVGLFGVNFPFLLRTHDDGTYCMTNVAGLSNHCWGHEFLHNDELYLDNTYVKPENIQQRNHGWRHRPPTYPDGAS
ncbi:hypothetical protein EK21DRAFT_109465 [Setomelanomma holmii]|uniref:Uncharacterized protein n=1 Tax=Setomelanomma holmii TaxID=210430 RepID=A0A9P4HEE7_9PLEO|nr:hypothetical protein EK21DRAFT_109465 [Setomelanomma holmii]